jgi:glycosyltransferase involved in cell wall biosynthesis
MNPTQTYDKGVLTETAGKRRPPKVAHVINVDFAVRIHLRNQLLYLQRQGYDVSAVCSPGAMIRRDGPDEGGIPVKLIKITSAITPLQDAKAVVEMVRYFRANRFDIVHTHSMKGGLLGRLAARLARVPVVIHTLHGFFFYEGMARRERAVWKGLEKLGMALGDYALSQNQEDIRTAIEERICKAEKIGFLGNGIDLEEFNPASVSTEQARARRRELGVGGDEKVVAIAGRLIEEKGYLEFFEAARLIRQKNERVRFWAMGASQPSRQGAISLDAVKSKGLEHHLSFLGMRPDIPELFKAIDVFVLPTHGREGVPRVLMEASAMGKPIVATNVRGCREAIIDGETGLLVQTRNPAALADAVLTLLEDRDLAARLGSNAREHALRHFDERTYFERIHNAYQEFLSRGKQA